MALSPVVKISIFVVVGLLLALGGLITFLTFPKILRVQLDEKLALSPTSETFKFWKDPPVPIYLHFYLFNVTNPAEVLELGQRPMLQEVGPYVFRETRHKVNITWHPNSTVSYTNLKRWYFVPEKTPGSLTDEVVTINLPALAVATKRASENIQFYLDAMKEILTQTNATLFVRHSVDQLLFAGYPDNIFKVLKEMLPDQVPFDHFGWFYEKNGTTDGIYTIYTGEENMGVYGQMIEYNGKSESGSYASPCDQVRGSAGDLFPPFQESQKPDELYLFAPDLCRSLPLMPVGPVSIEDIPGERYMIDHTGMSGQTSPTNCLCHEPGQCLPPGALNVSRCQQGSPVIMSLPHFLWADSSYRQRVGGMFPDPTAHQFYMDIQPQMGVPLQVAARLQVNVAIQNFPDLSMFPSLQEPIVLPVFWFSQTAGISDNMVSQLKLVTHRLPQYVTLGSFALVVIGGVLLLYALYRTITITRSPQRWHGVPTCDPAYTSQYKGKKGPLKFYRGSATGTGDVCVELKSSS